MNIVDATVSFFQRWNDFRSRSSRSEYWWPLLSIGIPLRLLEYFMSVYVPNELGTLILLPFSLFYAIASISLSIRRLHDMDATGWWVLLPFTIIGIFILFVWFCFRGTVGDNRFGGDPLQPENDLGKTSRIID